MINGKVFYSNSRRYLEGIIAGAEFVNDTSLTIGEIEKSDTLRFPLKLVIEDPEADELYPEYAYFDAPQRTIPHIEIDKLCFDDLMKLGQEGYYFPKIQSAPMHESMIIDMQLLTLNCTDVDRESVIDLLLQFTGVSRYWLRRVPMIYVMWEV